MNNISKYPKIRYKLYLCNYHNIVWLILLYSWVEKYQEKQTLFMKLGHATLMIIFYENLKVISCIHTASTNDILQNKNFIIQSVL